MLKRKKVWGGIWLWCFYNIALAQESSSATIDPLSGESPVVLQQETNQQEATQQKKGLKNWKDQKDFKVLFYLAPFLQVFRKIEPGYIPILSLEGRSGLVFLQESIPVLRTQLAEHDDFQLKTKPWSSIHGGASLKLSMHPYMNAGCGFDYLRSPRFSESELHFSDHATTQPQTNRGLIWHDFLTFLEIEFNAKKIEIKEDDATLRENAEKRRLKLARKKRLAEDPSYKKTIESLEEKEKREQTIEEKKKTFNQFNLSWIFRCGINMHWRELQGVTTNEGFTHKSTISGPGVMIEPAIRLYFRLNEQSYFFTEYAHTMLFRPIGVQLPVPGFRHTHKVSIGVNFMNPIRLKQRATVTAEEPLAPPQQSLSPKRKDS